MTAAASPSTAPDSPRLAALKRDAKSLLRAWKAGDPAALARLSLHHPKWRGQAATAAAATQPAGLREAQLVIAREQGYASWPRLKADLDRQTRAAAAAPDAAADPRPLAERFLDLACLNYRHDHCDRFAQATALLAQQPELATASIWTAAAVGDAAAVTRFLDADPGLLEARGGPQQWQPLLVACYSRVQSADAAHDTVAAARVLLARGADPDVTHWWDGKYPFTALTGVCGEGEAGARHQPRHPRWRAFAELLLAHGARPADSQALYNRMFGPDDEIFTLLLARGLGPSDLLPADPASTGGAPPLTILGYHACTAASMGREARLRLLIAHGARLDEAAYGRTPWQQAMHHGHLAIARLLEQHGAPTRDLDPVERFSSYCLAPDPDAARAMLSADPTLLHRVPDDLLTRAANADRPHAVRLLLDLGYDVNRLGRNTALHEVAWRGLTPMAQLLLQRGASVRIRDLNHCGTPVDWANHAGRFDFRDWLLDSQGIDLFTAVAYDRADRIPALLAAHPEELERRFADYLTTQDSPHRWETPLAAAVRQGRAASVDALLAAGADPTVRDPAGRSLAALAQSAGHTALAARLSAAAHA